MYLYAMKQCILMLCLLCGYSGNILDIAARYLGVPYVAGALEVAGEEALVIDEQRLDCTTFVELTVAHWMAEQCDTLSFEGSVQGMRYRDGVVDGYLSRLHYFSDWVKENTERGVWSELTPTEADAHLWEADTLTLSFMSAHPQSYPYLKAHAWAVDSIRGIEAGYRNLPIHYIKKSVLNLGPDELPIRNGDILALVTNIEGLDVTHLGFAVWKDNRLHLMHASMSHGKVVVDERTLYDYLSTRKSCPGVRAIRIRK